ncbi:MAG: DUF1566 domain-containing protein, partial [Alphaproteobacteria bacterium]
LGMFTLIVGLIGVVFSIQMDTSVSTYGGERINNLGLMNLQQNLVFICSSITIVGVFLIVMSGRSNGSDSNLYQNQSMRKCPFCAEIIKSQAILCRYCGKDLTLGRSRFSGSPTKTTGYNIGDTGPAGGKVFYVSDDEGSHGLEAAPADINNGDGYVWGMYGTSISGAQGTVIGTGAANTSAIVIICSEANTAAKMAYAYTLNGYSDWFLPSKDELNLLYLQKDVVGGFSDYCYWSSSEVDTQGTWNQGFKYGYQSIDYKNVTYAVRAVRAF